MCLSFPSFVQQGGDLWGLAGARSQVLPSWPGFPPLPPAPGELEPWLRTPPPHTSSCHPCSTSPCFTRLGTPHPKTSQTSDPLHHLCSPTAPQPAPYHHPQTPLTPLLLSLDPSHHLRISGAPQEGGRPPPPNNLRPPFSALYLFHGRAHKWGGSRLCCGAEPGHQAGVEGSSLKSTGGPRCTP